MADPFIDVDDLAAHMHRAPNAFDDDDAALQAVDAACDWLRKLTGQTFNYVEDETILMDGTGTEALLLPELPVEEVSSVVVAEEAGATSYSFALHDSGVLLRTWAPGGSLAPSSAVWPKGRNNVEVTYIHGYEDVPRDLRKLALKIAEGFYNNPSGIASETLGQRSVRYSDVSEMATVDRLIIRKYTYKRQPSRVVVS